MPERLCIFLDNSVTTTNADVIVISEKQQIVNYYSQLSLSEIAVLQLHRQVIIILSTLMVKISEAAIPNQNLATFAKALPYILEEECAEDIDGLHFSFNQKVKHEQQYLIVVIKKSMLTTLLDNLANYQIIPDFVTPDILVFTPAVKEAYLIVTPHYFMLRDATQAIAFEGDMLPLVLKNQLIPAKIVSFSDSDKGLLDKTIPFHELSHEIYNLRYHEVVAQQFNPATAINLISNKYGSFKRNKYALRLWYGVALVAVLWLSISFLSQVAEYFLLSHQLTQLQHTNHNLYQQLFPGSQAMVSPEARVKQLMNQSGGNQTGANLFLILQKITTTLTKNNTAKIINLEFTNNQLRLELIVPQFQALETIQQQLQNQQLKVKQLNASSDNNVVKASLEVGL